jgi:hypothetical protein
MHRRRDTSSRSETFCSGLIPEYFAPIRLLASPRLELRLRLYLHLPPGDSRSMLVFAVAAWFPGGATISRPYLPFGRYQASLGHRRLFHTVSPAHTLVRRGGAQTPSSSESGLDHSSSLADRFIFGMAPVDYDPVLLLKPFRPHLTVSALPSGCLATACELRSSLGCLRRFQLRARLGNPLSTSSGP